MHDADPRPRCYMCGLIGHFHASCRAIGTFVDDPNPPRAVYESHFAANTAQFSTPILPTPDHIPQQPQSQQPPQQFQQQSQYHEQQQQQQFQQQSQYHEQQQQPQPQHQTQYQQQQQQ